jgi:hypothetical protein
MSWSGNSSVPYGITDAERGETSAPLYVICIHLDKRKLLRLGQAKEKRSLIRQRIDLLGVLNQALQEIAIHI